MRCYEAHRAATEAPPKPGRNKQNPNKSPFQMSASVLQPGETQDGEKPDLWEHRKKVRNEGLVWVPLPIGSMYAIYGDIHLPSIYPKC